MAIKPYHEMRPGEIIEARDKSGIAFVPIGPIEWHSYHLPIGNDAILAEEICRIVAEEVGGVFFKALMLGVDAFRSEKELLSYGFSKGDKVFGMNHPELPLICEYCSDEELISGLKRRLNFIKDSKFKAAFVVDHHAAPNQLTMLEKICSEFNSNSFSVEFVYTYRFFTLKDKELGMDYGGHAGISETAFLLAFRPDLVDLSLLPEGDLSIRKMGMIHCSPSEGKCEPIIKKEYNPRNVRFDLANKLRENIVSNFVDYIKEKYL